MNKRKKQNLTYTKHKRKKTDRLKTKSQYLMVKLFRSSSNLNII